MNREDLIKKFHSPVVRMLYNEFIEKYGDESIKEYYAETGKQAFKDNGVHLGDFEVWLMRKPKYHHICRAIHIPIWRTNVREHVVEKLDDYYRKQIPKTKYKDIVYLVKEFPRIKEKKEVVKILNKRWIFKQLDLNLQKTDKREVFYKVRKSFGGKLNLKGTKEEQQKAIGQAVDKYYNKLFEFLGFEYWGYVPDYLGVDIKGTANIFDMNMVEIILTKKNLIELERLEEFENVPFFLIICEKTILIDFTMRELINRGYNEGFYGISLGGYPVSAVIKYLIPFSKVRNFYVFVQHDLDIDGLMIYFNIRERFPCESVGINPDFLEHIGVEFDEIAEDYDVTETQKEKQKEKVRNKVLEFDITEDEREKYNNWINSCLERRAEINSLLTKREEEDYEQNKARDFIDYLIGILEDPERPWNLSRYEKPDYYEPTLNTLNVSRPEFIDNIDKEIERRINIVNNKLRELSDKITEKQGEIGEEAYREFNEYLDERNVRFTTDWYELIRDRVNKMRETNEELQNLIYTKGKYDIFKKILRKNKGYKGDNIVKDPWSIIEKQNRQLRILSNEQTEGLRKLVRKQKVICKRIIKQIPEYNELKEEFIERRESFIETNFDNFMTELQDELIEILEEPIDFEELGDEEIEDIELEEEELEEIEDEEIDDEIEFELEDE